MHGGAFPIRNQTVTDQMEDLQEKQGVAIMALNKAASEVPAPSPYQVGDQVWLEATHLHLPYQSTKLAPKHHGPFVVTKKVSPVTLQLHLPTAWNIHNVFHASLLSPYHECEEHGPNYSRPPPDLLEGEEEYKVECIINHWFSGWSRTLQYLIKWKGYPDADNTWEPADQVHAPELVNAYHRMNPLALHKRAPRKARKGICFSLLCSITSQQCLPTPEMRQTNCPPLLGPCHQPHQQGSANTVGHSGLQGPSPLRKYRWGSPMTLISIPWSSAISSGVSMGLIPSGASSPKCKRGPYLCSQSTTSSPMTPPSTWTFFRNLSTASPSPLNIETTSTTSSDSSTRSNRP